MVRVNILILGFACIFLNLGVVWSTDIAIIEYLLNAKLTSWRQNVTLQIKEELLQEVTTRMESASKVLRKRYQIEKLLHQETRLRVTDLENENQLLKETIDKINRTQDMCSLKNSAVVSTGQEKHGLKLAIGEFKSGDIFLIDTERNAKWMLTSSPGILGMAYHPITKLLYVVTTYTIGAIRSFNILLNENKVLRKCSRCLAIGLDKKQNVLYFLDIKRKKRDVSRLYLKSKEISEKALVTYSRDTSPSTLAVDDVNQYVFVVLRIPAVIQQFDYNGKKIGEIALDPFVEDKSITLNLAVNKLDKILYYNIDDELWRKNLETDEEPELLDISSFSRMTGLSFLNKQLLVGYMGRKQIDVWTEHDSFQMFLNLDIREGSGSKHICMID